MADLYNGLFMLALKNRRSPGLSKQIGASDFLDFRLTSLRAFLRKRKRRVQGECFIVPVPIAIGMHPGLQTLNPSGVKK
jgi:hypothetical protein